MKTPILAATVIIAAAIAAATLQLRRPAIPPRAFRIPAEQLPTPVLDRLRHPGAPTYLVSWDRIERAALWRPTINDTFGQRISMGRPSRGAAAAFWADGAQR